MFFFPFPTPLKTLTFSNPLSPLYPPPRNGGMAMAIPRTNLEDRLQVWMNDKYNLD